MPPLPANLEHAMFVLASILRMRSAMMSLTISWQNIDGLDDLEWNRHMIR